jgi:hypothetical protein
MGISFIMHQIIKIAFYAGVYALPLILGFMYSPYWFLVYFFLATGALALWVLQCANRTEVESNEPS